MIIAVFSPFENGFLVRTLVSGRTGWIYEYDLYLIRTKRFKGAAGYTKSRKNHLKQVRCPLKIRRCEAVGDGATGLPQTGINIQ